MYMCEPEFPVNSKIYRQAMYTWWRREQFMSIHPNPNFSGQMSYLYPTPYPIGLCNPWAFNLGMNNIDSTVFPCFENGTKFCKSSKICDKTSNTWTNKFYEKGFQPKGQVGPRLQTTSFKQQVQLGPKNIPPPVHPSCYKQQGQLSPRYIQTPVPPCLKQDQLGQRPSQSQLNSRQVSSPVQHPYQKPFKNSFSKELNRSQICRFCLQNGERREFYTNHQLKDNDGKVKCPILQKYVCDVCKATGANAHTRAYCPFYKGKNKKPLAVILKQTNHDSCGRIRK